MRPAADGLGRIIEADEPDSGGSLTLGTCYTYDTLDNLTQVDQGTQTRTYTYDGLSRLTAATTPESATTNFYYTTSGGALCAGDASAVCRRADARLITTTYVYDTLNRLTAKTYSDTTTPAASYFYDQTSYNGLAIANGKGRRTGMSDGAGQTAWSYDSMGRVVTQKRTTNGISKTFAFAYNLDGSLASLNYPSGRTVTYTYSAAARPVSAVDGDGANYALNASYAPQGAVASVVHGQVAGGFAGITASYGFNNRLLPTSLVASSSNGTVLNLAYSYFANANISTLTNNLNTGRTQSFTYDTLNRLATAATEANSGSDCWGLSWNYDRWGNLLQQNVTKCSAPALNLSVNSATNRLQGSPFSYDAAGNLLSDGPAYTYDAENRRVTSTNSPVPFLYDGDDHRVKDDSSLYWFGPAFEVLEESGGAGESPRDYIFFNGQRVARRDSSGSTYYFFQDQVGSNRVVSNSTGGVVQEMEYYPFGDYRELVNNLDNYYRFAGQRLDPDSGHGYFHFRRYVGQLGRWASPDPVAGDVVNPQSLNRYAYVVNNPTNLIDPLGAGPFIFEPSEDSWLTGGGGGCTLNGIVAPCSVAIGEVASGAAVQCPNNFCSGFAPVGNGQIAFVQFNGGSGTYNVLTQPIPDPALPINQINAAYQLGCQYSSVPCGSNDKVRVRYVGSTYNVTLKDNPLDQIAAAQAGSQDPSGLFHNGDTSYYIGFGGLLGIDEGHVVDTSGGVEAHYDSFGPYNPLHWVFEALPSLFINTRGQAGAGTPYTCSVAGGCHP